MRLLIVEDNHTTANYLLKGLKEHLFLPDWASTGPDAVHLVNEHQYDVIILDVMLPGIDGWALVKLFKAHCPHVPVLFLTAKDTIEDKVKGLDLGADDYLVKPFSFSELLARLHVLIRRNQTASHQPLILENLVIDPLKFRVTRDNKPIALTAKEFNLLLLFMRNKGRPLSRTYIAEQIWDIHFECDTNVIDVAIKRLREKMDNGFTPKLIHTLRGIGYVMDIRTTTD